MIEIIYDETEQAKPMADVPIKLPKNIRQIGEGTNDTKIFIEDYVITFIHKFWERQQNAVGILLGEVKHSGKETYIFAPGAIKIDVAYDEDGNMMFDDVTWTRIYDDIKKYFNKYMIVGWFLNSADISCEEKADSTITKLHIDNFPGVDKVLLLADRTEREEKIYRMENGVLAEQNTYYVYFERNSDMQEYMMKDKDVSEPAERTDEGLKDNVPESFRTILHERKERTEGKRSVGFLYGACTFLAVVILMIGIAIMNNTDKIEGLEQMVSDLYRTAAVKMSEQKSVAMGNPVIENVPGNILPLETTAASDNASKTTTDDKSETNEVNVQEETTTAASAAAVATQEELAGKEEVPDTGESIASNTETSENKATESQATEVTPTEVVATKTELYVVKAGDTLTSISREFYNTEKMVDAIKAYNKLENGDYIFVGQVIGLP
ncbi:MAG: LysM peptidoglycan-binding domain-containing protein [Lachnospiraceae bacterium]|nr:LysM peptidoglycan-binding domain-containing protein [Lachnospiraceae bacterium]